VTGVPIDGQTVEVRLALPDGSEERLTLTARAAPGAVAGAGTFQIGATPAATAANLRTALDLTVRQRAETGLGAASAIVASNAFFAGSEATPPVRVPPPAASATALVPGTAANTVIWQQVPPTTDPRQSTAVRADTGLVVGVGLQADEQGFRQLLATLAAFTVETYQATPADQGRYEEMARRMRSELTEQPGRQQVKTIHAEIGMAMATLKAADSRHTERINLLQTTIGDVETANTEETAAKLLSVQTRLQASYQTTALLSRLNLTDYLR
jgi:flagellar hook-associated protein 3 FlgL